MTDGIDTSLRLAPNPAEPEQAQDATEIVFEANRRLARAIYAATVPHWLDLDVTMAQMKALIILDDESPVSIGDVAKALGVTGSTASILIDRLVRVDLVERTDDPTDRRRTLVELSPSGMSLLKRIRQGSHDLLANALSELDLDRQELIAFADVLERLADSINSNQQTPHTESGMLLPE